MSHRVLGTLSLFFALALVAGACSSGGKSSSAKDKTPETSSAGGGKVTLNGETANNHGTKDVSGGGSQDVEVDSFYFNPTVFTGKAGDKLTLTLSNDSNTLHNFSLSDQKVDQDIPSKGKTTVSVTFPASGTLVFFCKYHRSSGMLGGLQVEQG
jgi:plastocyanin